MPRTSTSTRELALEAIKEMLAQGIDPSVRSLRAKIGRGSTTTILAILNEYREQHPTHAPVGRPRKNKSAADISIDQRLIEMMRLERSNTELSAQVLALQETNRMLSDDKAALEASVASSRAFYEQQLELAHDRFKGLEQRMLLQADEERVRRIAAEQKLSDYHAKDDLRLQLAIAQRQLTDARAELVQLSKKPRP